MASQGPLGPSTTVDDATVGTVVISSPNNAKVSDGVFTFSTFIAVGTTISHYLKATNFGFSIPSRAIINGIDVEIERRATDNSATEFVVDSEVKIVKSDGTIGTTNKANTLTKYPTTEAYGSYGSSSDLWGETWLPSDINNSNFGVVLSMSGTNAIFNHVDSGVDYISITVYYSTPFSPFPSHYVV